MVIFRVAQAYLAMVVVSGLLVAQVPAVVVTEVAQLVSADIEEGDDFGTMVGLSHRTALIGVRSDDDACPEDPECQSGSAYIFELLGRSGWVEVAKLTASNAETHAYFGRDVDLDEDTAVVGADIRNDREGGVYVYERDLGGADVWGERVMLLPEATRSDQQFGNSVTVDGDTIIAAARLLDKVFVFDRDETGEWSQTAELQGATVEPRDVFGMFVSNYRNMVLIGSQADDDGGTDAGAAFIFERNVRGRWLERVKLTAADAAPGDFFGREGGLDGNFAAVGAPEKGEGCPDSSTCQLGAVYVFERNTGGPNRWGQVAKIVPDDPSRGAFFGRAIGISGGYLVVAAPGDDEGGAVAGAAYVYQVDPGDVSNWVLVDKVLPADLERGDRFGYSAAIDGTAFVIGADFDDTIFVDTGSAYVFHMAP